MCAVGFYYEYATRTIDRNQPVSVAIDSNVELCSGRAVVGDDLLRIS